MDRPDPVEQECGTPNRADGPSSYPHPLSDTNTTGTDAEHHSLCTYVHQLIDDTAARILLIHRHSSDRQSCRSIHQLHSLLTLVYIALLPIGKCWLHPLLDVLYPSLSDPKSASTHLTASWSDTPSSLTYLLVSCHTSYLYVGETGTTLLQRLHQHLYAAMHPTTHPSFLYRFLHSHSPFSYAILPVTLADRRREKEADRRRTEQMLIQHLQPKLNSTHHPFTTLTSQQMDVRKRKRAGTHARRRPHRSKRQAHKRQRQDLDAGHAQSMSMSMSVEAQTNAATASYLVQLAESCRPAMISSAVGAQLYATYRMHRAAMSDGSAEPCQLPPTSATATHTSAASTGSRVGQPTYTSLDTMLEACVPFRRYEMSRTAGHLDTTNWRRVNQCARDSICLMLPPSWDWERGTPTLADTIRVLTSTTNRSDPHHVHSRDWTMSLSQLSSILKRCRHGTVRWVMVVLKSASFIVTAQQLSRLVRCRYAWRDVMRQMDTDQLVGVLRVGRRHCNELQMAVLRNRVAHQLQARLHLPRPLPLPYHLVVRLPFLPPRLTSTIKAVLTSVLHYLPLARQIRAYLSDCLRVVTVRQRNMYDLLTNHISTAKAYRSEEPFACTCDQYRHLCPPTSQAPACTSEHPTEPSHLVVRASQLPHPYRMLLDHNLSNIPAPSLLDARRALVRALEQIVTRILPLTQHMRQHQLLSTVHLYPRLVQTATLAHELELPSSQAHTGSHVSASPGSKPVSGVQSEEQHVMLMLAALLPPSVHARVSRFVDALPTFLPQTDVLPDSLAIRSARTVLERLILCPIDKNSNQLALICPAQYHAQLTSTYVHDPHYGPADRTGVEIVQAFSRYHRTYHRLGLSTWSRRVARTRTGTGIGAGRVRPSHTAASRPSTDSLLPAESQARRLLPYAYILPKHKDLQHKTRPIVSYVPHPLRPLLQLLSRALTFLLLSLPPTVTHYTLWRTSDICQQLSEFLAATRQALSEQSYTFLTCCSDIKNMFTELAHEHILTACQWLVTTACEQRRTRTRARAVQAAAALVMERRAHGAVYWSPCYAEGRSAADQLVRVPTDCLSDLIRFDLSHIFFTLGDLLLQQHRGAPMGGYVSATYAIIACAYDEYRFHATLPANIHLLARRYIDDLLTIIAVPTGSTAATDTHDTARSGTNHDQCHMHPSQTDAGHVPAVVRPGLSGSQRSASAACSASLLQLAHDTMHRIQHECYHPSLQLEPQQPDTSADPIEPVEELRWQFLDAAIHVQTSPMEPHPSLHTTALNKNWQHLTHTGHQLILRYQHWVSFSSMSSKLGVLKSALLRLQRTSTHTVHFCLAVMQLRAELMDQLAYPPWTIRRALTSCYNSTQQPAFIHAMEWLRDRERMDRTRMQHHQL